MSAPQTGVTAQELREWSLRPEISGAYTAHVWASLAHRHPQRVPTTTAAVVGTSAALVLLAVGALTDMHDGGGATAADVAAMTGMSASRARHHLAAWARWGWLKVDRQGSRHLYRFPPRL